MLIADFLSRYRPRNGKHIEMDHTIHAVRWSEDKLRALKAATANDTLLAELKLTVQNGWPSKCSELPKKLHPYWTLRDYIGVEDGILTTGQQVIVPESLHSDLLHQLHDHCHQGVEKTQLLARKCVYWPKINDDIARLVSICDTCNTLKSKQQAEPMHLRELPSGPWEMLASDLFECNGSKYLLVCDCYSKFHIMRRVKGETSACIVQVLKEISLSTESPQSCTPTTDHATTVNNSHNLRKTTTSSTFITSSPQHAQSNGFAERMVGTIKSVLKKCAEAGQDPELGLLFLRTTTTNLRISTITSWDALQPPNTVHTANCAKIQPTARECEACTRAASGDAAKILRHQQATIAHIVPRGPSNGSHTKISSGDQRQW